MSSISGISSSLPQVNAFQFQRPPRENYKMTDDQKDQLQDILSNYDVENMTDEDTQSLMDEIKSAGIKPGDDLKTALEDAGVKMSPPPNGGQPPMGGPGQAGQTPQFLQDFVDKYESGELTDDDIESFIQTIKSQGQMTQGVLFDQTI